MKSKNKYDNHNQTNNNDDNISGLRKVDGKYFNSRGREVGLLPRVSGVKMISETKELIKKEMLSCLDRLDIKSVKEHSVNLFNTSMEIKKIIELIKLDESNLNNLTELIRKNILSGRISLEKLLDEFNKVDLLSHLKVWLTEAHRLNISLDDLPINEVNLIKLLGYEKSEMDVLQEIFSAYIENNEVSIEDIFEEIFKILVENNICLDKEKTNNTQIITIAHGIIKSFSGASLIGLNLGSFYISAGIMIQMVPALASSISGTSIMIDGLKELGIIAIEKKNCHRVISS